MAHRSFDSDNNMLLVISLRHGPQKIGLPARAHCRRLSRTNYRVPGAKVAMRPNRITSPVMYERILLERADVPIRAGSSVRCLAQGEDRGVAHPITDRDGYRKRYWSGSRSTMT
jgi:hypothetical protein